MIDVLQSCVSFNKVNTFAWYRERCYPLPQAYDPTHWGGATKVAREWGDKIPVGIIYRNDRLPFEKHYSKHNPFLTGIIMTTPQKYPGFE